MMIQTQRNIFHIMASENANWFIYYFKRIPFIGKILPDSIYGNITLKKRVAVLAAIAGIFGKIFGKAFFAGLSMVAPVFFMEKSPSLRYAAFLHIFLMISLIGSLLTSFVFEADRNRYICIRLMHMNPKTYIVSTLLFDVLTDVLYMLPVLLLVSVLLGGTLWQGLLLTALVPGLNLFGEIFHLYFYSKLKVMLCKKAAFEIAIGVLCLAAAYVPPIFHRPLALGGILFSPACILAGFALLAAGVIYVVKFNQYHEITAQTLKSANFMIDKSQIIGEARFSDVAMREKEFTKEELNSNRYAGKKGFAYLNAIFFERHKRILVRPILFRLCIIAVLFVACMIASFFLPDFLKPLSSPAKILPVFVFLMYLASIGEKVCKAMFYNCDISLLRYSFYRDKKAVLSNFKVRLFRVAGLNFIVAFAISAAVVGLALIYHLNWSMGDSLFFVLTIFLLSLFFSVHHLFLYYVFQPYTTELGMKNPFYSIINTVVYLLSYLCLQIKSAPSYFTMLVLISTILYIVTALILVRKYAWKTFRVK